jgi:energy-coupling factor transporter ATP-binding protein EcfA2
MTRKNDTMIPDQHADPFGERSPAMMRKHLQLLGGRFRFESNSRELLRLVDEAYADLPRHRLSTGVPPLRVRLWLMSSGLPHRRSEPPALDMLSGSGFLGGATGSSNFVILSPRERAALVAVSPQMLKFPYHTRYELIEFAVFTLAARSQKLASLHAACVGRNGRGILLMGPSGAGKSTVTLHCLLQGFDFLSEDSVFVTPDTMLATGVANFLHVRSDSLRWLERARDVAAIRKSPVIRRRSGVRKFELNLRRGDYRLAPSPLKIAAVVFLSAQNAGTRPLLKPLSKSGLLARLAATQGYAANQPEWSTFSKNVAQVNAFELRRGRHPLEAVEALGSLLGSRRR